jgi:hypothetical protein
MFVIPEAIVGKTLESKMEIITELKLKGVPQLSVDDLKKYLFSDRD